MMTKFIALLVFGVLLVGCATEETPHSPAMHAANGMVLNSDTPALGDYSLYQVESQWTNQMGDQLTLDSLSGAIQVVALTYTSCEVSCPRIVADMKRIRSKTSSDNHFLLISLDPERDTVQKMADYAATQDLDANRWNLVRGDPDDVLEMAALLGVRFRKMADGEYAHSNIITILDAQGTILYQQQGLGSDLTDKTISFLNGI